MGKLRGIPVLMLIALLACDAAAAQGSSIAPAPTVTSSTCEISVSPSPRTGSFGDSGGGALGGLQGDPDDLIDGNRAKPKLGANGTTGSGTTGLLSSTILWVRLYGLLWLLGMTR